MAARASESGGLSGLSAFPLHEETAVLLGAPVDAVFAHLDDFRKLSSHMEERSGMMAGSKMSIEVDEAQGKKVGSKVSMSGTMLGMRLSLEEIVTQREPPWRKAWETLSTSLIVIGRYRLGFELTPEAGRTRASFFIDYALPDQAASRWLGVLFGRMYARWCIGRMAEDAARQLPA